MLIVGFGPIVAGAPMEAAEPSPPTAGPSAVINARFAKPLDRQLILDQARGKRLVVTLEESTPIGGFGSARARGARGGPAGGPGLPRRRGPDHRHPGRPVRRPRLRGGPAAPDPARRAGHRGADPGDAGTLKASPATRAGIGRGAPTRAAAGSVAVSRGAAGAWHDRGVTRPAPSPTRAPPASGWTSCSSSAGWRRRAPGRRRCCWPARVRVGDGDGARHGPQARRPGRRRTRRSEVAAPLPYVSRGGEKLAGALDAFGVDPARPRVPGRRGLHGRLHRLPAAARRRPRPRYRRRPRPARGGRCGATRGSCPWSAPTRRDADARPCWASRSRSRSSTSRSSRWRLVLGADRGLPRARAAPIVALVKPQFEAGRGRAPGGVVRDPAVHREVLGAALAQAASRRARPARARPTRRCWARPATASSSSTPSPIAAPRRSPRDWAGRIAELVPG